MNRILHDPVCRTVSEFEGKKERKIAYFSMEDRY